MKPALPISEIHARLQAMGYSVVIKPQQGIFVAKGTNDAGDKIEAAADSGEMAAAGLLRRAETLGQIRLHAANARTSSWQTPWHNQSEQIARAYTELPSYDTSAVPAWQALANESAKQADAIRNQVQIEQIADHDPYKHHQDMLDDIHHKKHMFVSVAGAGEHPVWNKDQVINYRIVHNAVGHGHSGGDHSWIGQNVAVAHHMPMLSPLAQEAAFVESIGHPAYLQHYPGLAPRKIALMSEFLKPVRDKNGEHVHVPHGQQSVTQLVSNMKIAGLPAINEWDNDPTWGEHIASVPDDPNRNYSTPAEHIAPLVQDGSPQDHLDRQGVMENIDKFANAENPWWEQDPETQRKAILNAFKVSILSPRKDLAWNAAHYQAIKDLPSTASLTDMFDASERARDEHNQTVGMAPGEHLSYHPQMKYLEGYLHNVQGLSEAEALRKSKEAIALMVVEAEKMLEDPESEAHGGNSKNNDMRKILRAREIVGERLNQLGKIPKSGTPKNWSKEVLDLTKIPGLSVTSSTVEALVIEAAKAPWKPPQQQKWGGMMFGHLESIASVAPFLEPMRLFALKDIYTDGGRGYIWRAGIMSLKKQGFKGASEKVASFTWLLLAPKTSDLAIIDTHAIRGLGYREEDLGAKNNYHAFERAQRAARDATGYGDMPQGAYHWGMWDMVRTPGQHSDHSMLRPLDPVHWRDMEHPEEKDSAKANPYWKGAPEFEATRPLQNQVMQDFLSNLPGRAAKPAPKNIYQRLRDGEAINGITHVKQNPKSNVWVPNPNYVPPEDLFAPHAVPGHYIDGTPIGPQIISKTTGWIPKGRTPTGWEDSDKIVAERLANDDGKRISIKELADNLDIEMPKESTWEKVKSWLK